MAPRLKGKWAQGIQPRSFAWVIKDKLAVCERPGGFGTNHRRVRRQEEIIWIREQGFGCVVSLLTSPHNLHNYDELGVTYRHRPFALFDDPHEVLPGLYREMNEMLAGGTKVVVHADEVGDRIAGVMGGFIRWAGLVKEGPQCISVIERITGRQLEPFGRAVVAMAPDLH